MICRAIWSSFTKYNPTNFKQFRAVSKSAINRSKKVPEEAIPKNLLGEEYPEGLYPKGSVFSNRPFKVKLEANKKYAWCACGQSKSQPFCDGTHKIHVLQIQEKPIIVMVEETKEYWLCNCKQSDHRPFCDGTHLDEEIQSKFKYLKV